IPPERAAQIQLYLLDPGQEICRLNPKAQIALSYVPTAPDQKYVYFNNIIARGCPLSLDHSSSLVAEGKTISTIAWIAQKQTQDTERFAVATQRGLPLTDPHIQPFATAAANDPAMQDYKPMVFIVNNK